MNNSLLREAISMLTLKTIRKLLRI